MLLWQESVAEKNSGAKFLQSLYSTFPMDEVSKLSQQTQSEGEWKLSQVKVLWNSNFM